MSDDEDFLAPFKKKERRANHVPSISERAEALREQWNLPPEKEKSILTYTDEDYPISSVSWAGWEEGRPGAKSIHARAAEIAARRQGRELRKSLTGLELFIQRATPAEIEQVRAVLQNTLAELSALKTQIAEIRSATKKQDVGGQTEEGESPCGPGQVLVDDECVDVPPSSIAENAQAGPGSPAKSRMHKTFAKGAPCPFPRCKARGTRHVHESKAWGMI